MIPSTLQNNGQMMAAGLPSAGGKGRDQNLAGGFESASPKDDGLPFPLVFARMVDKVPQVKEAVSSSAGHTSGSTENVVSEAARAEEQRNQLKINDFPEGEEGNAEPSTGIGGKQLALSGDDAEQAGESALTLEVDLQTLLQAIQNHKSTGKNPGDAAESGKDAASLLSYLAAAMSARQNQNGAIQSAGAAAGGRERLPAGMQGNAETILSAIDKLLSSEGNLSPDGTGKGNKILLTVPQDYLKNFAVNQNGQPHFSMNGSADGSLPGEGEVAALDQNAEEKTLQLIRLNVNASSSSPQGALLSAVMGTQKTRPSGQTGMKADSGNANAERTIPGNPSAGEARLETAGEQWVSETLLHPDVGNEQNGATVKAGTDPRQGLLSPEAEFGEQERIAADPGTEAGTEAAPVLEDASKRARLIAGKESVLWVPNTGMSSPQVSPDTASSMKGVFIPMDEVVSKAGVVLEKGGKVQMTLQPPSLGTINMEVVVQNNRVELVLTTGHTDVQQMLQAGTDQLKSALQNQGFQIDQMSVLLRQENFGFNSGENPLWQNGSGQKENNGNGYSAFPSAPEADAIIHRDDYETGTISIFA